MKKIILAVIIGYSVTAAHGMETPLDETKGRTYRSAQVSQFYALELWYTNNLQLLIDRHFDQQIDFANFDSQAQRLYKTYKTGKDRILNNKKQH
ncbi:MAG TPA: hypothetical protein VHO47_04975 [Candidatus Babeliales bacterium]|nr:hypothetical protein [Candidatus Babeliales bacterium]